MPTVFKRPDLIDVQIKGLKTNIKPFRDIVRGNLFSHQ